MKDRDALLKRWVEERFADFHLSPASEDASFRRYFRVRSKDTSLIVMDAPPALMKCDRILAVASAFLKLGLNVPRIHEADLDAGFIILDDFGREQYLDALNLDTAERLYGDALASLSKLQLLSRDRADELPPYDSALLRRELSLFDEWFLGRHLGISLANSERLELLQTYDALVDSALEQPVVWVHRDYHSRNLMVLPDNNPGILDFQDAVAGPVTYDLVSLLRDCYVSWPRPRVEGWALAHQAHLERSGFPSLGDPGSFLRWFDFMGMQRHLKAIGIFARLLLRDGKPTYVNDIPRTLGYVLDVGRRHGELSGFLDLLERIVLPAMASKNRCSP